MTSRYPPPYHCPYAFAPGCLGLRSPIADVPGSNREIGAGGTSYPRRQQGTYLPTRAMHDVRY
eukprot:3922436-Rhodomonas_salina.1